MLLRVDLSTTIRIYLTENSMLCYGPLVSELGGRVHGAPNPVIGGGGCAPRTSRLRRLWTCYGTGIFLIFITVLTSLTKKKYIQPTNILLVMWSISQLLWLKPTRRHISEKSWMYRWLNRSARFCDAPAQWFTLGPTSCVWFLDKKCDQLTDMQTRLRPTPQAGRSVATFDLRWPVTALSVSSALASSACWSVGRISRLEINSRTLSVWQCTFVWGSFLEFQPPLCVFTIQLLLGYDDDSRSTVRKQRRPVRKGSEDKHKRSVAAWLPDFVGPLIGVKF